MGYNNSKKQYLIIYLSLFLVDVYKLNVLDIFLSLQLLFMNIQDSTYIEKHLFPEHVTLHFFLNSYCRLSHDYAFVGCMDDAISV